MIDFILGGARSGKSALAEQRAQAFIDKNMIYIATAQAHDSEMKDRIAHHRQGRSEDWTVVEEPLKLHQAIKKYDDSSNIILVDCLTLWMSNLLMLDCWDIAKAHIDELMAGLPHLKADIILVSNETGLGVVPIGQLTRQFVDESGRLHQQIGKIADRVTFCVAGFPMILKGSI